MPLRGYTLHDGIAFFEETPPGCRPLGSVKVELGGMFTSAQLKSLDDVKTAMARLVKRAGGNALVDFKYGQRSVGFLKSFFSRDDVTWYGSGMAAVVTG